MSKRKAAESVDAPPAVDDNTPPSSLVDVQTRITQLMERIPTEASTVQLSTDKVDDLLVWCKTIRSLIRHYNLSLHFIRTSTYQWKPDRQGHTSQSLNALLDEISVSNNVTSMISSNVNNILTPSITRETKKIIKTKVDNVETEEYVYENKIYDPDHLKLDMELLCDEAVYKRHLLILRMKLMHRCIGDYIKAEAGRETTLQMSY